MPARILFCRSNPIAPDPRVEKEAQALSNAGYLVTVLGWDRTGLLPTREDRQQYQVLRLPIRAAFGKGMGNLPQLLRWQAGLLRWLVSHRSEYDLIHACDFDTVLPAYACKLLFSKRLVYDIFDFYADHLRATPEWIKGLIRGLDRSIVRKADAVILVDDARVVQLGGSVPRRMEVIVNSPSDQRPPAPFPPSPAGMLRIAYVGLLQVERGLLELIDVVRRHPGLSLDLAGFGGDEETISAAAAGVPGIRFHGRISYSRTLELSAQADCLIATYDPAIPNHRLSSPNKLFEAMMLAKPIVVAADTNMDRIVRQYECGMVVTYGDVASLESTLLELADNLQLRQKLGEHARQAYDQAFDWKRMEERLLCLYRKVLEPHG